MADPIIENCVRAQCIWQAPSGLPEDRFVTTWAFQREFGSIAVDGEEQANEVAERLREFWLEPVAPVSIPVAGLLPSSVTAQGLEIRCYDLGQAPPREPRIYEFPTEEGSGAQALPRECAITMSFYAGRNLPRQRGRVFIGPLTVSALHQPNNPMVSQDGRLLPTRAAERLALGEGFGDNMRWSVLSQKDAEIREVTAGWVDDAFDTIRKRGNAPTARTMWPEA